MPPCIVMKPSTYVQDEPMVKFTMGAASFALPQRAVKCNSLAEKFVSDTADVSIELHEPMFQDAYIFGIILDYMNRCLDNPASTLRQLDLPLVAEQWKKLNELELSVFGKCDRNPFWTGLTGQHFTVEGKITEGFIFRPAFTMGVQPDEITVKGPEDSGFTLKVNLVSLTNPPSRPVSLLAGVHFGMPMEFPFPVDFESSFFIPHTAIECKIEGKPTVCEGVLHSDGTIRIEPIDAQAFMWFHFQISPRISRMERVVYGETH